MKSNRFDKKFYLVREDVLPDVMKKTMEAKELLDRGKAESVGEAASIVDLSRSAFYKYRDTVFPFSSVVKDRLITLFIYLEDRSGALSRLLSLVAEADCNVLTIHQTIPLQGRANITISLNISQIKGEIEHLLEKIRSLDYVEKVEVVGSGV
ncbi:ACT domain-containing protein [Neobacillus sp. YIM B06451]|uniref:ACT domain-containing protein n=1 Tax=Neobacillus sp. YIM B06451 TaxID=3070994 RepID=UPI00292D04E0|nr:ACT domain-containing protein [Neobacillus sp. YIM B06451]